MSKQRFSEGSGPSQRQLRVGELVRRAVSDALLRGDIHDPEFPTVPITVGEVRMSPDLRNATVFVTPLGGGDASAPVGPPSTIAIAATVNLSINEANQLVSDLHRAGAMILCDQEVYVTDVPLHTLTIMEPRPDAIAHTFSYWAGVGQYAATAAVVDNFVETYFPGL